MSWVRDSVSWEYRWVDFKERRSVLKVVKAERRLEVAEEKAEAMWEIVEGDLEWVDGIEGLI